MAIQTRKRPVSKIKILVISGVIVGGLLLSFFVSTMTSQLTREDSRVTYEAFSRIRNGQTFDQVVETAGSEPYMRSQRRREYGPLITRDQMGDETLHWPVEGGGAMSVTFEDEWETGLVIRKVWNAPVPEYLNSDFSAPKPR